ncbi:MAG: 2-aminoethylphosphonate--pyruvate transaminase [Acetobacteraceae bacterium]|nr:2-aminoethylphosphonate--pyruvate transaminase [Acetobacteraceae bacterium]
MILLTPGPVQTRPEVKAAMACDVAPWDETFRPFYAGLRDRLLRIAGGIPGTHAVLPLQASGHMIVEAAIRTFVPEGGAVLAPKGGEYANRLARLARDAGRRVVEMPVPDSRAIRPEELAAALAAHPECGHVALVHSETGSGTVNDPARLGPVIAAAGRRMILDSVSGFGALPFDMAAHPECDAVVFTSNKCLEGLPGFAFAVSPIARLEACRGQAKSWSLDLGDVWENTVTNGPGSLRFTGPVQVLRALDVALGFHEAEGQAARLARYAANARLLRDGLIALGLRPYLAEEEQGPIIVTMHQPEGGFDLPGFVRALRGRGVTISSYFTTEAPTIRIGAIGAVGEAEIRFALAAIGDTLAEMGLRRAA